MTEGIQLALAGDTALGGSLSGLPVETLARRSEPVTALLKSADLRFLSFDCAIGLVGEPLHPEEYVIDCDAAKLSLLKEWGINVVSLANNHSTDHGLEALLQGRQHLTDAGINVVGVGRTAAEAATVSVVDCHGLKVGWLAFASDHAWVGACVADATTAGVAGLDEDQVLAAVRETVGQVDALIVSLHWGKEYINLPPPNSVRFARKLIDVGVRVVVGHHPHVIQPVECYGSGVICYSLGNFLFPDYPLQSLTFRGTATESLLVSVMLDDQCARIHQMTTITGDHEGNVRLQSAQRHEEVMMAQQRAAQILGTQEGDRAWQRAVRQHEIDRLRRVLRQEVIAAGFRGGTARLLRLGGKNLRSLGRSLGEIIGGGPG